MIPGLFGGQMMQPQIDPWRQQLQQLYAGGTFGGHSGHQAFAGPATMQAYAMSGEGRHLNPASTPGAVGGGMPVTPGMPAITGSPGGGGLSDMIRQVIEYQRQQGLFGNAGGGPPMRIPGTPNPQGAY